MISDVRNDGLDPVELTTLTAIELGFLLNDIDVHFARFARSAEDAWRTIGDAEDALEMEPGDKRTIGLLKKTRAYVKAATVHLSALKLRQSRIQTILRTIGPAPQ